MAWYDVQPNPAPTHGQFSIDEVEAMRNLVECCGMQCKELPTAVRVALHQLPDIDKTHQCDLTGVSYAKLDMAALVANVERQNHLPE